MKSEKTNSLGNLLRKEIKLTAPAITFIFILFALMVFIPNYPILLAGFFVCFGLFHSFQSGREAGDIFYSAMLPVEKKDVVRAKFMFSVFIQMCAFAFMLALVIIRLVFMKNAGPYVRNAMMNGNLYFLGMILIIYGCFNLFFIRNFFRTAYSVGIPFLLFGISTFLVIGAGETLHHIPALKDLNSTGLNALQVYFLAGGIFVYVLLTAVAEAESIKSFERIDL